MGPAAVGTAIGAATVTVGRGALAAVGNGLSFLAQLASATGSTEVATEDQSKSTHVSIQQRCDELRQRIQRQLSALGIKLVQQVELISNGQGGIAVAGSHPQREAIEGAVGSDILLERDFHELARDYEESAMGSGPLSLVITEP